MAINLTTYKRWCYTSSLIRINNDDGTKNIKTDELTDELSGEEITLFVSTGPKSYSFNYGDKQQKSVTMKIIIF